MDALLRRIAHVPDAVAGSPSTISMSPSAPGAAPRECVSIPEVGSCVDGRYQVEAVIGQGGMGVVLSARNLRTSREVALKYMNNAERAWGEGERPDRVARFVREAQAAGRVRHPNVVDIYDASSDLRAPYLVMERLHGESVWARMERGPVSVEEALRIMLQAARGVAAAHRQGVIHRDLKPENLFLANVEGQAEPVVKVLDFGISRILDPALQVAPITRSGSIVGTPAYMPIEQLRAEREADARADVYALGAILFELVSQRRPYEGKSLPDLVVRMANEDAAPLQSYAPQAPRWLCACLARCLSRDPEARYADAGALVVALERGPDTGELPPAERAEPRLAPPGQRAWGRMILVSMMLGALGLWWLAQRSVEARTRAPLAGPTGTSAAPRVAAPSAVMAPAVGAPAEAASALLAPPAQALVAPEATPPAPPLRPVEKARRRAKAALAPLPGDAAHRARDIRPEDF